MSFKLPTGFPESVNRINGLLNRYEDTRRDDDLRTALEACCSMLRSIDLEGFADACRTIFRDADAEDPQWKTKIFGTGNHFQEFLAGIEERVLRESRIDGRTRARMYFELTKLTTDDFQLYAETSPEEIVFAIGRLTNDICSAPNIIEQQTNEHLSRIKKEKAHSDATGTVVNAGAIINIVCMALPIPGINAVVGAASIWMVNVYEEKKKWLDRNRWPND